jgi:hypothetical protein
MPPPNPHYTLSLINHETGERLKIELIDLPFPEARSYRIRVHPVRQTCRSGLPVRAAGPPGSFIPRLRDSG